MPAAKGSFSSKDALLAATIAGGTLVLVGSILVSAERVKRDSAESIVDQIASANKKRLSLGKPAVTGRIDDSSALVVEGELEPQEWDNLPYVFSGAERPRGACILAEAVRRPDGPAGGVCATVKGEVAAFEGTCALDCREAPPPPPPPPVAVPVSKPPPPPPVAVRHHSVVIEAPELAPDKPKKAGCSVTGCFGTSCCDTNTDSCQSCPGAACCAHMTDCNGTCQNDDDCTIGCGCTKLPGSPWGNCRGK